MDTAGKGLIICTSSSFSELVDTFPNGVRQGFQLFFIQAVEEMHLQISLQQFFNDFYKLLFWHDHFPVNPNILWAFL